MPNAKNQQPTTVDERHYQRYRALSKEEGKLVFLVAQRRAPHNWHLDSWDVRKRVLARYRRQGNYLSEVELVRMLLYAIAFPICMAARINLKPLGADSK